METKTVTVEVTQEDIDEGQRQRCFVCPIALATNRVLKGGFRSAISPGSVDIYRFDGHCNIGREYGCRLPTVADVFVDEFDLRRFVSPISFPLELPVHVLR